MLYSPFRLTQLFRPSLIHVDHSYTPLTLGIRSELLRSTILLLLLLPLPEIVT